MKYTLLEILFSPKFLALLVFIGGANSLLNAQSKDPLLGIWNCSVDSIRGVETIERDKDGNPIEREIFHEEDSDLFSDLEFTATFSFGHKCSLSIEDELARFVLDQFYLKNKIIIDSYRLIKSEDPNIYELFLYADGRDISKLDSLRDPKSVGEGLLNVNVDKLYIEFLDHTMSSAIVWIYSDRYFQDSSGQNRRKVYKLSMKKI